MISLAEGLLIEYISRPE